MRVGKLALAACLAFLLLPSLASAQPPTFTYQVGSQPWGVAIDTGPPARVYVSNYGSGTVSVLNEVTGALISTIRVGTEPEGIAVDQKTNRIYVANFGSQSVSVINGGNYNVPPSLVATIRTVGLNPNSLAVDATGNRLYVGTYGSSAVDVINITFLPGQNLYTVPVQTIPGASIHDVVFDPANGDVYASVYNANSIAEISPGSHYVNGMISGSCGPDGLAIDPTRNILWEAQNYCDPAVVGLHLSGNIGVSSFTEAESACPPAYVAAFPGETRTHQSRVKTRLRSSTATRSRTPGQWV